MVELLNAAKLINYGVNKVRMSRPGEKLGNAAPKLSSSRAINVTFDQARRSLANQILPLTSSRPG